MKAVVGRVWPGKAIRVGKDVGRRRGGKGVER